MEERFVEDQSLESHPQNNDEQWAGDGPDPAGGGKFMGVSTISKYSLYRLYSMLTFMHPSLGEVSRTSKTLNSRSKKLGEGTDRS
jgi:hypothetical protein